MITGRACLFIAILAMLLFAAGCQSPSKTALDGGNQVKLRSIQSRVFDTGDKDTAIRVAMATMQDLGFVIDAGDLDLGTVSATKLDNYAMRMTVSVRNKGTTQVIVRASAQFNLKAVEDPVPYQQFFAAYEKAMFLKAQNVD
jgi:hypothetical protein